MGPPLGVTFISQHVRGARPRCGHVDRGARQGARARAGDLSRARERAGRRRGPRTRSSTSGRGPRGDVDRPLVARGAARRAGPSWASNGRCWWRSERWGSWDLPRVAWWSEVPSRRIEVPPEADSLLAVGGGSAIDTAEVRILRRAGYRVVSVPTTYSGAEWTPTVRRPRAGPAGWSAGEAARDLAGIVYDVGLTLELPLDLTVGTAMNSLRALCRGALRARPRTGRRRAGARRRGVDRCVASGRRRRGRAMSRARTALLRG